MTSLQIFGIIVAALLGFVLLLPSHAYGETMGSVAVSLSYSNGDIADYWPVSLKIFQDTSTVLYRDIESLSGNPFNIVSLPVGHQYKIEAYVNGLHASDSYVNLQQLHQDLNVILPLSGGMRLDVYYNDGVTPLTNATVSVVSLDNKTWAHGMTNVNGQTLRFWLEPTVFEFDHYAVNVRIGKNLAYTQSPVFLLPGISQEVKVVTNWPPVVSGLITVNVLNSDQKPLLSYDNLTMDAFDSYGNMISESPITPKGEAYFSSFKVGDYQFKAIRTNDSSEIGALNATIDGSSKMAFTLYTSPQIKPQVNNTVSLHVIPPTPTANCNCVAFRLDNVQDYWLDNVQAKVIDTFYQKDAKLTLGIIANAFGNDSKLTSQVKNELGDIDLAINGWNFEDFTVLDEQQQQQLLEQSKQKIASLFGVAPTVFIPPYGKADNDTFAAMSNSSIDFLSSSPGLVPPHYLAGAISVVPTNVMIPYYNATQNSTNYAESAIKNAISNYGFAVVHLNFQDYAQQNGTSKINTPDLAKIQRLEDLIDKIQADGIKIFTIEQVGNNTRLTTQIPSWIKNNAKWWSEGLVSDDDFVRGIQYLVQQGILQIPQTASTSSTQQSIPVWVKNTAGWWANGQVSDQEFVGAIQYLISNGIIRQS